MIFDGITFRRNDAIEFYTTDEDPIYVKFRYRKSGKDIPLKGYSLTNMAYARDGRVLLAKSGMVFTAPRSPLRRRV